MYHKCYLQFVSGLQILPYDIKVFTGNTENAGTDANVTITIYGEFGNSGIRPLKNKSCRNKFERNKQDNFHIKAVNLGKNSCFVYALRIGEAMYLPIN